MATKRRKPTKPEVESETKSTSAGAGSAHGKILTILRSLEPEQQNEAIISVLTELKADKQREVEESEEKTNAAKTNLQTLQQAIQQGVS